MPKFRLIMELENSGLPYPIEKDRFNNPHYLDEIEQEMKKAGLLIEGEHILCTKLEKIIEEAKTK